MAFTTYAAFQSPPAASGTGLPVCRWPSWDWAFHSGHRSCCISLTQPYTADRTLGNNTVCSCCHLQFRQQALLCGFILGEHTGFTDGQFTQGRAEDTIRPLISEKGCFVDKRAGGIVDGLILSEHGRSSPF